MPWTFVLTFKGDSTDQALFHSEVERLAREWRVRVGSGGATPDADHNDNDATYPDNDATPDHNDDGSPLTISCSPDLCACPGRCRVHPFGSPRTARGQWDPRYL